MNSTGDEEPVAQPEASSTEAPPPDASSKEAASKETSDAAALSTPCEAHPNDGNETSPEYHTPSNSDGDDSILTQQIACEDDDAGGVAWSFGPPEASSSNEAASSKETSDKTGIPTPRHKTIVDDTKAPGGKDNESQSSEETVPRENEWDKDFFDESKWTKVNVDGKEVVGFLIVDDDEVFEEIKAANLEQYKQDLGAQRDQEGVIYQLTADEKKICDSTLAFVQTEGDSQTNPTWEFYGMPSDDDDDDDDSFVKPAGEADSDSEVSQAAENSVELAPEKPHWKESRGREEAQEENEEEYDDTLVLEDDEDNELCHPPVAAGNRTAEEKTNATPVKRKSKRNRRPPVVNKFMAYVSLETDVDKKSWTVMPKRPKTEKATAKESTANAKKDKESAEQEVGKDIYKEVRALRALDSYIFHFYYMGLHRVCHGKVGSNIHWNLLKNLSKGNKQADAFDKLLFNKNNDLHKSIHMELTNLNYDKFRYKAHKMYKLAKACPPDVGK